MRTASWLALAMVISTPACGQGTLEVLGTLPAGEKIDPRVRAEMIPGRRIPVVVLGATQFLQPPEGFDRFVADNVTSARGALRTTVLAGLKRTASEGQVPILSALGPNANAHPLWIVNAIVADLLDTELEQLVDLPSVGYVYHAGVSPRDPLPPVGSMTIVTPVPRGPFDTSGVRVPWNIARIRADRAWTDLGVTGEGVVVAVLDAGVNYLHTDLRENTWVNTSEIPGNGIDDDDNGLVDDVHGFDFAAMRPDVLAAAGVSHGTWVAGIVAGDGTGSVVTGVAPRARILPLRSNSFYGAALAYQYALEAEADVMNMSFSLPGLGHLRGAWRMMSDHATAAGLVLVSGAGNFRRTASPPVQLRIPEGIPSVIAAGGVDSTLRVVPFSSGGPVEWASVVFYEDHPALVKPDVAGLPGPGYPILDPGGSGYIDPNLSVAGNSFSGPHAAGVAALVLSAAPQLTAWRVKQLLELTAQGDGLKNNDVGFGLLDAFRAVQAARQ